ncbi:MAG TPA: hypothetical protein VLB50_06760 [Ignavibacteriaceae bacterium]|nr:hypothetical protein [Ignavibacteriaceae bacterium]
MKNIILRSIALLCIAITSTYAQNLNGRFSSAIYSFERYDTVNVSSTYLQAYEMLMLNLNKDNYSLRTYLNFESDFTKDLTNYPRVRFYDLYFEARKVLDAFTIKLGRQPIINSVAGGLFDGINLDYRYDDYKFSGYYGGNVPAYQKLELTDSWTHNFIAGGKFVTTALRDFRIGLSYINKNFKPEDYMATRLDANLNPIQVLIQNSSTQYQFASAEVDYDMPHIFTVDTRYDYDLNFMQTSKFEFYGTYDQLDKVDFNVYYNYRSPKIRYNSIFAVFDFGNTQEIEAGAGYKLNKLISISGKFADVVYKDENSQRITLGLISNYGSITYRKNLGYAGEMDAISLYAAYTLLEGLLTPSAGISYTNYKLSDDAETDNLTTLLAGFNLRPYRTLSFDIQGQYMNNKIYKNDFRLFAKLNYWFNTNF